MKTKTRMWLFLAVAAVALALLVPEVMKLVRMGPRDYWGMLRYDQREEGDLAVGDEAPDVVVTGLDGAPVHLGERFGGRPVVLI
ncbi:MAG: deiodinase-related protein, partial [Thermoanaerobaculia bacterium]